MCTCTHWLRPRNSLPRPAFGCDWECLLLGYEILLVSIGQFSIGIKQLIYSYLRSVDLRLCLYFYHKRLNKRINKLQRVLDTLVVICYNRTFVLCNSQYLPTYFNCVKKILKSQVDYGTRDTPPYIICCKINDEVIHLSRPEEAFKFNR